MTQVKFLIDNESETVFAFFPELDYNVNLYGKDMKTCYAHLGQHSACLLQYAKECKEADINDYFPLLNELIGQGYNDLQIMNSYEMQCHRQPTKEECKRGYGAIHYRNFPLSVIGLKKGKAMWKDWFIAPDDNLRYYTN